MARRPATGLEPVSDQEMRPLVEEHRAEDLVRVPVEPQGEQQTRKPPRIIMRFAVLTAIGLALATAGILVFVRHNGMQQAEQAVTFHAAFVADSLLRTRLRSGDFTAPVTKQREAELDRLFRQEVLVAGTLHAELYGADGRLTYASQRVAGPVPYGASLLSALRGRAASHVSSMPRPHGDGTGMKVLAAYAPVRVGAGGRAGVLALYQDYGPIARTARKAFLPVAGVLQVVLLTLYVALLPLLRRVTKRMDRQLEEIQHQSLHDGLTGLANRDLFRLRLQETVAAPRRQGDGGAVLLLDLDRFKEINDTLGHQSGDLVLQAVAKRLRGLVRRGETVARLGGDEFGVVAPHAADADAALALAQRVRTVMEMPFALGGLTFEIETSIGVALFPGDAEDVETLIRHADVAMYVSKETHRPALYVREHDPYSPERLALVGELRNAIERDDLVVHYQPRAHLGDGQVRSVEALVRWRHQERGLLTADEFVPLAEHTGLIRPLTRYVLGAALAQCRRWDAEGIELGVAVNVSKRDLLDAGIVDEVLQQLAHWGVDPERLELEISEKAILTDGTRPREVLDRLSAAGVRLAIDDFGTGYSSLTHLKRLPVDVLKIDKSFVSKLAADQDDLAIVRSTIELGHNLGLEVVAEGVESLSAWNTLAGFGCEMAQGYYLSRPVPADLLTEWLRGRGGAGRTADAWVGTAPGVAV